MGAMQRNKGKNFERKVAEEFRTVFADVKRTLTQQRDSGEAPDIDAPGHWVEAKNHQRVNIQKAYAQAVDEATRAKSTAVPLAVTQDFRAEPLATLSLKHYLDLLKRAYPQPSKEFEKILPGQGAAVALRNVLIQHHEAHQDEVTGD